MPINIDTQSVQYQNYLNGLATLENEMLARVPLFKKLSTANKIIWLDRDPLFKNILKFINRYSDQVDKVREEIMSW